jgi:hypothetical protein
MHMNYACMMKIKQFIPNSPRIFKWFNPLETSSNGTLTEYLMTWRKVANIILS